MQEHHPAQDPTILEQLDRDFRNRYPGVYHSARQRRRQGSTISPSQMQPRKLRIQDRILLITAIVLTTLLLIRVEVAEAQDSVTQPSGAAIADAGVTGQWGLELHPRDAVGSNGANTGREVMALDTAIEVDASGLLARVHVLQSFRNPSDQWMEGAYRFPLPDGAAVDRLFIKVGDRVLEGEIQERESAARVYQEARAAGQTASLVTQERRNQFATRLANIGPGETVHIMIAYLLSIDYADGEFSLRLPGTFTPRYAAEAQPGMGGAAPRPQQVDAGSIDDHGLSVLVNLRSTLPLSMLQSRFHDVDIQPTPEGYRVEMIESNAKADRDFELRWSPAPQDQPQATLSTWSDGGDIYAQLMLVPPRDQALLPQSREVILVIDTSGSMEGPSMEQARAALGDAVAALQAGDRFNVIQFNSVTEALFPEPVPVNPKNRAKAARYIDALSANGGTEMAPALTAALRGQSRDQLLRQVVFITDGSIGNERELLTQIGNQLGESRLFTVGIGPAPNAWFMRRAAEIGRGHHTQIGRLIDVADSMTQLWDRIRLPAIADLCIDWGQDAESYPEILPDLYAGQPLWVIARLADTPQTVTLCGELNGQRWEHTALPLLESGDETLATLWGQRKIDALQDGLVFGMDPELTRAAITQVALDFQLLTPHTSLVAVDRTPARPADATLAMGNVPSLLPAGSSSHSASFPATATGWKAQLSLSLLVLLISGWWLINPFSPLPVILQRMARKASRSVHSTVR